MVAAAALRFCITKKLLGDEKLLFWDRSSKAIVLKSARVLESPIALLNIFIFWASFLRYTDLISLCLAIAFFFPQSSLGDFNMQ